MKFTSPVYSAVSGSIAGITYARNAGGMYARARAVPVNPATEFQTLIRSAFAGAAQSWALDLDDAEQAAWNVFGTNVPVTDSLGQVRHRSGQNWYGGSATLRVQAGLDPILSGPTVFAQPPVTAPAYTIVHAATTVHVAFTNTDDWANEDGGALLIYASRPQNPGRNFFKGPYRLAGVVLGDGTTAPTSPATVTLPFAVAGAGTKMFFKAVPLTADGRYGVGDFQSAVAS